jgi:hypothetical protein
MASKIHTALAFKAPSHTELAERAYLDVSFYIIVFPQKWVVLLRAIWRLPTSRHLTESRFNCSVQDAALP